jgi:hypothetical protein
MDDGEGAGIMSECGECQNVGADIICPIASSQCDDATMLWRAVVAFGRLIYAPTINILDMLGLFTAPENGGRKRLPEKRLPEIRGRKSTYPNIPLANR